MILFKHIKIRIFMLTALFFIFTNQSVFAQKSDATPLQPEKFHTQRELGVYSGLGLNIQSGSFLTKCDCPAFENGTAFGWKFGFLYEQDIIPVLQFGAALGINSIGVDASYQYNKDRSFTTDVGGTVINDTVPILFRQEARADFLNFEFMPYIKWSPASIFFVRLGFDIGLNLSSNIKHSEEILQKTVQLPSTGEIVEVSFKDGSTNAVVENGDFPNIVSPQFYIVPAVGLNIPLSENIFLAPVFDYSLPLSQVSTNGNGFSIADWRIVAELRWAFRLRME